MARFMIDGMDDVMSVYTRKGQRSRTIVEDALKKSANTLKERLQREVKSSLKAPSGELGRTIGWDKIWHMNSASGVYVYPQGNYTGVRGTKVRRAAEVGFVIEHGRGGVRPMEPNPWNARGARKERKRINTIITEELKKL